MTHAAGADKVVVAVHGPVADATPDVPGLRAWSVLRPHPDEPAVQPDGVGAVVMAWLDPGAGADPASWFDAPVFAYRVDEVVPIDWDGRGREPWVRDWPDGTPTPAIVQCSFVRRLPSLSRAEFAAHWHAAHAPLVPVHHPGVARYVQNVVVDRLTSDAPEVDGIAQLYFRTAHDLHERFYDSEAGRRRVGEDVARFIDRPRGWRITARETWLRSY
ncbi:MAG: EthD domain-containing protein [Actinomycetota bacterium]